MNEARPGGVCEPVGVTMYRVRVEAPTAGALQVVTALADASGVDLVSSGHPSKLTDDTVELIVEVDGSRAAVESAIDAIRDELVDGASISLDD